MILLWTTVFLLTFSTITGFPDLRPKEGLIYKYDATVQVGIRNLVDQSSYFHMNGLLQLNRIEETTLVSLKDLQISLYNGPMENGAEKKSVLVPLPIGSEDILAPFQIVYGRDKKVEYILVKDGEKEFSRNIKKAIASLLQVDLSHVGGEHVATYTSNENNIYGNGNVNYTIIPYNEDIIVHKVIDLESFTHWKNNNEILNSLLKPNNTVMYSIEKGTDDKLIIKNIFGSETIIFNFLEMQHMKVDQKLNLMSKEAEIPNYVTPTKNYSLLIDLNAESDLTFERQAADPNLKKSLYTKTFAILKELVEHKSLPISDQLLPGINHFVHRLQKIMRTFDIPIFEFVYNILDEETGGKYIEYFQEQIPLVGTKSSTVFIRNLIRKDKVNEDVAVSMLRKMSHSLRNPSEELLKEILDLLTLNMPEKVKNAAVLSFATILHKTFEHSHESNAPLLEVYIDMFVSKITTTDDIPTQYLYINALYNINVGSITEKLLPIIRGEYSNVGPNVRYLAMCAAYSDSVGNPEKSLHIYWPIMTNRSLTLDLRIGAYTILTTNPRYATLFFINAYMETEPDKEFYSYHYKNVESMASDTSPSQQEVKEVARRMIKTMRKPFGHQLSGRYMLGYHDKRFGYDFSLNAMVISTETSKGLYLDLSSVAKRLPMNVNAVWIKVSGHDPMNVNEYVTIDGYNVKEVIRKLLSLSYSEKSEMEISWLKNDQVVFVKYYDNAQIKKFNPHDIFACVFKNYDDISYNVDMETIIPNSMGFPMRFHFEILSTFKTDSQFSKNSEVYNYQNQLHYSKNMRYYLEIYNSVTDNWQGIEQSNVFDISLPLIHAKIAKKIENENYMFELSLYRDEDDEKSKLVLHSHSKSFTYVSEEKSSDILKSSNPTCQHVLETQFPDNIRIRDEKEKYTSTDKSYETGIGTTTDMENLAYEGVLFDIAYGLHVEPPQKYSSSNILGTLMSYHNMFIRSLFYLHTANFRGTLTMFPVQLDHIDIKLKLSTDFYPRRTQVRSPNKKIDLSASYALKDKSNITFKENAVEGVININPKTDKVDFNINAKDITKGVTSYHCLEGKKEWLGDTVEGKMSINAGNTLIECLGNDTTIQVKLVGERSEEQKALIQKLKTDKNGLPKDCYYSYDSNLPSISTVQCYSELTSYRNYTYDVERTNDSEALLYYLCHLGNDFLNLKIQCSNNMFHKLHTKFQVHFPMHTNDMKIRFLDCEEWRCDVDFTSKPGLGLIGFYPGNDHYSQGVHAMNRFLQLSDSHIFHKSKLQKLVDDGYTNVTQFGAHVIGKQTIWADAKGNEEQGVFSIAVIAKEIDNDDKTSKKMILRIEESGRVLEALDSAVTVDGSALDLSSYHYDSWFSGGLLPDNTLMIYIHEWDIYVDYNGEYIRVVTGPSAEV